MAMDFFRKEKKKELHKRISFVVILARRQILVRYSAGHSQDMCDLNKFFFRFRRII